MDAAPLCERPSALHGSVLSERFVYWRGVSGKRYLHTVYPADVPPEAEYAVVLLVRGGGSARRVLRVVVLDGCSTDSCALLTGLSEELRADELHVHALAASEAEARDIAQDLIHAAARDWARHEAPRLARRVR